MHRESKTPPHSLEAERAVLGAVLKNNAALAKAHAIVSPADFYQDSHRLIFAAMVEMAGRGHPIDLVTLQEALQQKGRLETVGGVSYVWKLLDCTPTAGNVRHYAQIVRDRAVLLGLRRTALEVLDLVDGDGAHGPDGRLMARAKDLMSQAVQGGLEKDEAQPLVRFTRANEFEAPPLEWLIEGFLPKGILTLFSGKDTIGKSLFALEIACSVLTGQPLLNHWPMNDSGPVAALFLDDPHPIIKERLETLGLNRPDLFIATYEDVDLTDTQATLMDIEAKTLDQKAKLIVLDSLWHFVPYRSGAANDQSIMAPLMKSLTRLAGRTGAAVILVAHDKKSGEGVAGSHVIRAAPKNIMQLKLPSGVETDPNEIPDTPDRILKLEGNLVRPSTWRLKVEGVGRWTFCGSQKEYRGRELEYELLDYLQCGGEGTADEIREALGKKAADVRTILKQLAGAGKIQADEQGTGGRPKIIYHALTLRPDEPLRPDPPDEKSQGELIDIKTVTGLGGFSSHNPVP